MMHEKELVREDGSRVKICTSVYLDFKEGAVYILMIYLREPRKIKWVHLRQDDYIYRSLSMEDRKKSDYDLMLTHVTKDEIWAAKIELWEKLKPTV